MAEVAPAPVDPPAAKPKKKSTTKVPRNRGSPTIKDLIVKIVAESKDRKGMSTALLKKNLAGKGYDVEKNKARIRIALKGLVAKNILNQTTGVGASGSFKLAKKTGEPKKRKSAAPSKTTPVKKPAPKRKVTKAKSPGKVKTASKKKNSPKKKPAKKVSKPAPAKKAASGKSRKGAAPKSPRVKRAAKKASAAKKTSKPKVRKAAAKK